jgi:hypothetical protein
MPVRVLDLNRRCVGATATLVIEVPRKGYHGRGSLTGAEWATAAEISNAIRPIHAVNPASTKAESIFEGLSDRV